MAVPVVFGSINVNTLNSNASISNGINIQPNWSSHNKQNMGTGRFYGINWTLTPVNYILDNDLLDTPIVDPDAAISPQTQTL